jgi:5-(carboxyamino)imidazole ribonucleotide mutase
MLFSAKMINNTATKPTVGIIMGSQSDWSTMGEAAALLKQLDIPLETKIVSAHRTPKLLYSYAEEAEERGIQVIIAGAGGAAHLPGMTAAVTHLPVLGVPVQSKSLSGQDSLLSIVQMPAGIPVMTLAIGVAGAKNAALSAASILSLADDGIRERLKAFRANQTQIVLDTELPKA